MSAYPAYNAAVRAQISEANRKDGEGIAISGRRAKAAKRRALGLTLIELLITCFVLAVISATLVFTAAPSLDRYVNPYSDHNIELDVAETAAWMDHLLYRATAFRRDFKLIASPLSPSSSITVKWSDTAKTEKWQGEYIALKVNSTASNAPYSFHYDHLTQTLTPAVTFRVYNQKKNASTATKWYISISGYGFVRTYSTS